MKTYFLFGLLGLGLLSFLLWLLTYPEDRITNANYEQITIGMTEAEVCEILGGPEGYYTKRKVVTGPFIASGNQKFWKHWIGDERIIRICFDKDGIVISKNTDKVLVVFEETFFDRVRRWLGLKGNPSISSYGPRVPDNAPEEK